MTVLLLCEMMRVHPCARALSHAYMYVSGGEGGEVHTVVIWFMLVGSVGGGFIDIATELNNGAPFPGDQSITQRASIKV